VPIHFLGITLRAKEPSGKKQRSLAARRRPRPTGQSRRLDAILGNTTGVEKVIMKSERLAFTTAMALLTLLVLARRFGSAASERRETR
jgi:hypothetical protein